MISGPFRVTVSSNAERIDFSALPEESRAVLGHGISFDPEKHDCYRFFILPVPKSPRKTSVMGAMKRWRASFERINRVYVRALTTNPNIRFLGMLPTTCLRNGQWVFDINSTMFLEARAANAGLRVDASMKNTIRRDVFSIYAGRTDAEAHWYFLENWLQSGGDFKLQLLCRVEKSLAEADRRLICDVAFQDDGRVLANVPKHIVRLPVQ